MLINNDNIQALKELKDNSIDSVVTDPPYGLSFMGKKWDYDVPSKELWLEVFRVLKPGGHLLSFGGSRTYHRLAVGIEDAGFEIRDQIMWVYGSGFPKSHNIGKAIEGKLEIGSSNPADIRKLKGKTIEGNNAWDILNTKNGKRNKVYKQYKTEVDYQNEISKQYSGWGTALKPAHEPIVLARKPLAEKTVAENVLKWGTGGINIDECRVEFQGEQDYKESTGKNQHSKYKNSVVKNPARNGIYNPDLRKPEDYKPTGRFPANFIHDGSDEVVSMFPETKSVRSNRGFARNGNGNNVAYGSFNASGDNIGGFNDSGSASRFFYCAKASKSERNAGLDGFKEKQTWASQDKRESNSFDVFESDGRPKTLNKNNHPTVKPVALMRYLARLITPKQGTVLDPFMGSGTTGIACKLEGFEFVGIEIDKEYFEIAKARIENTNPNNHI